MFRIIMALCGAFALLTLYGCSNHQAVVDAGNELPVHYVAIDIDDIFQPNWDSTANTFGTVKMTEADVKNLVLLSHDIQNMFGMSFKFTLGFNSGFYDSSFAGDRAWIDSAKEFCWFNHLPRHEHIVSDSLNTAQVENLFFIGDTFAHDHGIILTSYMVTPLHEGIWPPYDPLYKAFEKYHILYTSTENISTKAQYDNVEIEPRHIIYIGSGTYSSSQVSNSVLIGYAARVFDLIKNQPEVILYSHQANYAKDRPGEILIRELLKELKEQKEFRVVILPSEEMMKTAH